MFLPDFSRIPEKNVLVIHGILLGFVRTDDSDDSAFWFALEADDVRCSRIFGADDAGSTK